jgi:purine-binding chemotaxis protein CheW
MKNPPDPLELDNAWAPSTAKETEGPAPAARSGAAMQPPTEPALTAVRDLKSDIRSAPVPKPPPERPGPSSPAAARPKPPPIPRAASLRQPTPAFSSTYSQVGPRTRPAAAPSSAPSPEPADADAKVASAPRASLAPAPEPAQPAPVEQAKGTEEAPALVTEEAAVRAPALAEASQPAPWFEGLLHADSAAVEQAEPELRAAAEEPSLRVREQESKRGSLDRPLERSICAFWIGNGCFAIDTELVGEVVSVSAMIPVPLAPKAVLGLFNLRGTPVPLVDLASVLSLPNGARPRTEQAGLTALVLRSKGLHAAVLIDRMEAVLAASGGRYVEPSQGSDHPAVKGFVEMVDRKGVVATLLDSRVLMDHFERLTVSRANRARPVSHA